MQCAHIKIMYSYVVFVVTIFGCAMDWKKICTRVDVCYKKGGKVFEDKANIAVQSHIMLCISLEYDFEAYMRMRECVLFICKFSNQLGKALCVSLCLIIGA